ncbi:MAG: enoyl-CoA hydratase [Betaproteobacteria bacterium]
MSTATTQAQAATTQAEPILLKSVDNGIATLTLNRPKQYNALSGAMLDALQGALESIETDPSIRVVVIAGNGPAFCAGHDLKEMRAHPEKHFQDTLFAQCSKFMLTLARIPQPVIARVHGIATAAGCQLVGACDLAVVSDNAKFAVSGINVGLFCSTPSVALSRNVSRKRAMEMLVTGDFVDAATAREFGLVNRVVPLDRLDAEVKNLSASIVAKSAVAISMGKKMFYRQLEMGVEDAYALAAETMACNMMADDAAEGIDAFMQKRPPVWTGR